MKANTKSGRMPFLLAAIVLIAGTAAFLAWQYGSAGYGSSNEVTVEIPARLFRNEVADFLGEKLGWNEKETAAFASTYMQMQWAAFNAEFLEVFEKRFGWNKAEREAFLTSSAKYFEPELDFLSGIYAPGAYTFARNAAPAAIAEMLIIKVKETAGKNIAEFIRARLPEDAAAKAAAIVQNEVELLPDLVPFPAKDIVLEKTNDAVYLRFSTIYFNQGRGPLELRADPATKGVRSDLERRVLQRIYREDGTYRERSAGTFLWHQKHLHYHFADFVVYDLETVEVKEEAPDLSGVRQKSTFCVRDISRVKMELEHRAPDAAYKICGKELQGISVGWGDTYFFSYPDQLLNVVDLPSGTYRLTFIVNPSDRFGESRLDNNKSSVLLSLDMKNFKVKVLEESPSEMPEMDHVYPEQEF
ncbi:MAG: lysyl oxidase family protein [Patescibacteria group bacterium]